MSQHTSAVFNNSCLKVPINPLNKLPSAAYEQKHIHQLKNQALKSRSFENTDTEQTMKTKKTANTETLGSLLDFYDSIPDYSDINHLSNQEFYRRIDHLKEKQKSYYECLDVELNIENKVDNFVDDYKKQASGERSSSRKCDSYKNNHKIWDNIRNKTTPETDSVSSFGKEIQVAPTSRRSVRIESPNKLEMGLKLSDREFVNKSQRNVSSAGSKDSSKSVYFNTGNNPWDDVYNKTNELLINSGRNTPYGTKSLPGSPSKQKPPAIVINDGGITIPKPFQMTIRDEEEKIVNDIMSKNLKPKRKKPEMFKAHSVPIESQIPLFNKIMADQEIRRQLVKLQSKEELLSKMKPFSFTRREEEMSNMYSRFSKSTPQLCPQLSSAYDEPSELNVKPFRAKPVPKNLFSNYVYRKMHEDEFYRALKKKIRAEEMLKASSLPPSMAKREKSHKPYDICPRSYRYLETPDGNDIKMKFRSKHIPNFEAKHDQLNLELDDLKNDFISTTPRPFKFQTEKRHEKKRCRSAKKCYREYDNIEINKRAQSALELQSVNRSNLAAVLRIQSARLSDLTSVPTPRKRMEQEMCRRLEEQKLKEESRWREKVMRQRPVWQELNYSHEEELAMRLQLRKEEERLREQEHRQHMDMMHGRVQQIPTLFERQSQMKAPKTRKELMQAFYEEMNYSPLSKKMDSQNGDDINDWDKLEKIINNDISAQTLNSQQNQDKQEEMNESCECSDED